MRMRPKRHDVRKGLLSLLLVLIMTLSLLPASVYADTGGTDSAEPAASQILDETESTGEDNSLQENDASMPEESSQDLSADADPAGDDSSVTDDGEDLAEESSEPMNDSETDSGSLADKTVINITYNGMKGADDAFVFGGYPLMTINPEDFTCDVDGVTVASVEWEKSEDGRTWEDYSEGDRVDGTKYYCLYFTFNSELSFPTTTTFTCSGLSQVKSVIATPKDKEVRLVMDKVGGLYPEARIGDVYYAKLNTALTVAEDGDEVVVIAEGYYSGIYSEENKVEYTVDINKDITVSSTCSLNLNNKTVTLDSGNTLTVDVQKQDGEVYDETTLPENGTNADSRAFTVVNEPEGSAEAKGGFYLKGTIDVAADSQLDYSGMLLNKAGGIYADTASGGNNGTIHLQKDALAVVPEYPESSSTLQEYADAYPFLMTCDQGAYAEFDPVTTESKIRKLYISLNTGDSSTAATWARVVDSVDITYSGDAFRLVGYKSLPVPDAEKFSVETDALAIDTVIWQESADASSESWVDVDQTGARPIQIKNTSKYRLSVKLKDVDAPVYYRHVSQSEDGVYSQERYTLQDTLGHTSDESEFKDYNTDTHSGSLAVYGYFETIQASIVQLQSRLEGTDTFVTDVSGGGIVENSVGTQLTAPDVDGYGFRGWYTGYSSSSNGTCVSTEQTFLYNPTENVTLTAVYYSHIRLTVNASHFTVSKVVDGKTVTVEANGEGSGTYSFNSGTLVTVKYIPQDTEKFLFWTNTNDFIVSEDCSYTFKIGLDTVLTANTAPYKTTPRSARVFYISYFKQVLDVEDYTAASEITFPSDAAREGYTFTGWDKTADEIREYINSYDEETENYPYLIVNPTYTKNEGTYSVRIRFLDEYGNILKDDSTVSINTGSAIVLGAYSSLDGYDFQCWRWETDESKGLEEQKRLSTNADCELKFYNDVTLDAVFGTPLEDTTADVVFTGLYGTTGTGKKGATTYIINIGESISVPADSKVSGSSSEYGNFGFLVTTDASLATEESMLMEQTITGIRQSNKTLTTLTRNYGTSITLPSADTVVYLRGYVKYTDASGEEKTVYTDIEKISYEIITEG